MPNRLDEVLRLLDPPPGEPGWAGDATSLDCLHDVDHEQALWRPAEDHRNIWELTLHIAYWKYAVRRKLEDSPSDDFARQPPDWPQLPDPADAEAWQADLALLRDEHRRLVEAVRSFDPTRLDERPDDQSYRYADRLFGIVVHDAYHVGQIQWLKRLYPSA